MDLKEMFNESGDVNDRSYDYTEDIGLKKYKPGRKIKFMRGYTDDGELIFDPFDPKQRNESPDKTVNYNKKFSKEMKQHHKLIRQQALYVDQLEKLFRATTGLGTANPRQLTKTDVELASVLSQARGQLLQMINGVSGLKKTISELQLKQWQRENGGAGEVAQVPSDDLRGSSVLQQIFSSGLNKTTDVGGVNLDEVPDISLVDGDELVSADVKNENRNITLAIIHDTETSKNIPVAMNESGEVVDDYKLPYYMNEVDIYPVEGVAKDKMGHTFPLIVK